jgi:hypothetical protein
MLWTIFVILLVLWLVGLVLLHFRRLHSPPPHPRQTGRVIVNQRIERYGMKTARPGQPGQR